MPRLAIACLVCVHLSEILERCAARAEAGLFYRGDSGRGSGLAGELSGVESEGVTREA